MELNNIYNDILIEHYRRPFNKKILNDYNFEQEGINPSCGDELHLYLKIDNDKIKDISFEGKGCSISIASASIMCYLISLLKEHSLNDIKQLINNIIEYIKGNLNYDNIFTNNFSYLKQEFEDLLALKDINKIPVRLKCALLSWITLKELLDNI
ncbi:MAG: Fe-S cluster assembly sulfur transfer protein SufU [bacterium]|jgi:nitrogen fixation NifU-like protein